MVQVDTGSDLLWVTCSTCTNCPRSSDLGIPLNFFDISGSPTATMIPCSHPACLPNPNVNNNCSSEVNECTYSIKYADGSGTYGYYVSDVMHFDMFTIQSEHSNPSATVVFGCSTFQSGHLTETKTAIDGIFGFGPGALSVVSQLSSEDAIPQVFSHCLKGDGNGGGLLVLGEMVAPNIVYTPLVPSQRLYNVYLESIAVNGHMVSNIDSAVFATSHNGGTIVDSGTTLSYLVQEAYDPFINAITTTVSQFAEPVTLEGRQCYQVLTGSSDRFPPVSLNFKGGASMIIEPKQYLRFVVAGVEMWCIGFHRSMDRLTVLGDLVLQDKIIIYDLANERIGWTNYDCTSEINVSMVPSKPINAGQLSVSCSKLVFIMALMMHIIVFIFL